MDIEMDRIALLIGRLVLQLEAADQQIGKLTKDAKEAQDKKDGD